jgi:sec-independent protein translocase protein TatC
MGFLEHLDALRTRIVRACLAVGAGMLVSLFFYDRLGTFVLEPTLRVLPPGSELIFTRPSEMFAFYFNVALIGGVILAAPLVSYHAWKFIAPGLRAREKRLVVPFVTLATLGALGGAVFSHYLLFPSSISFFGAFTSPHVRFMPRVEDIFIST